MEAGRTSPRPADGVPRAPRAPEHFQASKKGRAMLTVQHILDKKRGMPVASVAVDESVLDAARIMNERRIGALVVTDEELVVGVFTERDVMNRVVATERMPRQTLVRDVMTTPIAVCRTDTTLGECRSVMKSRRIRHLPVVEEGRLLGIISIGDILEDEWEEQDQTIHLMYEYMHGSHS